MGNSTSQAADMSTERYSAQQDTGIMREFKPAIKMVLLGETGDGKSSSGNTILSQQIFTTESSPESLTAECKSGVAMVGGRTVTVVDTPGVFDTRLDEKVVKSKIIRSIIECAPAVDALVIVLKVQRYTEQEIKMLDKIVECCGEDTFKHAVVLFTHGEDLEDQTIEAFVEKSPKLQELVDKCGGRCHVIDNKHWNDYQLGYRSNRSHVNNMLETIDKMVQENGRYTNELSSHAEEDIQDEMESMDTIHLLPEERREAAKKNVHKKYLIRFAGVATGTLVGAFLGIGVAVGSVVALLKAAKAIATTVTAVITLADTAAVAAAGGGTAAAAAAAAGGGTAAAAAVAAAAAGGAAGGGTAAAAAVAGVVEAVAAAGATAAGTVGAVAVEAGIVTGAAGATAAAGAAAGAVAVEAGVVAGAGIGAAAGTGIAAGVILGAAALAGAVGGGVTGYKAVEEADSVLNAIKMSAKANYENAKGVIKKAEQLPEQMFIRSFNRISYYE